MSLPTSNTSTAPRIAVIGGGISGLAAAHRITELAPHAELALFEASGRLGGILDTATIDGFLVERSADNFLTKLAAAVDLCRRLGIAEELLPTDEWRRRALVVRDGRLVPIPEGFYLMSPRKLGPLLASPILSLAGKLRLLAEPLVPRRKPSPSGRHSSEPSPSGRGQVAAGDSPWRGDGTSGQGEGPDESVASFARRRLGREVFERLVQPLVAGMYTADPEKLSMAATMPDFLAHERELGSLLRRRRTGRFSDQSTIVAPSTESPPDAAPDPANSASGARYALFAAPQGGMKTLIDALASRLPAGAIHLNAPVSNIERQADGQWRLSFETPAESSSPKPSPLRRPPSFDALVVALPAHAAAKLLDSTDPTLGAELAAIEYAGCAVVSLGFARGQIAHPLNAFGLVVPHVENRRIVAASFASLKFPGRAPDDHVLIRVFIGGALQPELAELPDAELRQLALEELADLLGITGQPVMTDIARWPRAMPQYHVGHLDRVARIEQLAASHPGLALAGNAYHGVGIPQCITSGERAAERTAAVIKPLLSDNI